MRFALPANSGKSERRTYFLSPLMSRLRHSVSRQLALSASHSSEVLESLKRPAPYETSPSAAPAGAGALSPT